MDKYKVTSTSQVQSLQPGADQPTSMYRAYLRTAKGATGFVDVDPDVWATEELREILAAKATELNRAFAIAEE